MGILVGDNTNKGEDELGFSFGVFIGRCLRPGFTLIRLQALGSCRYPFQSLTRNGGYLTRPLTHPDFAALVDPLCGKPQRG